MHSVNKRIFITFPNYPLFKKQKRILSKNEKKKKNPSISETAECRFSF